MRFRSLVIGLLLLAVSAFAADVDGKWSGTVQTPMGDFPMAFTFKADGAKLTGSMTGMDGMETPIAEGKVDGNNISYSVTLNFGEEFKLSFKGVVAGNQIKLSGDANGMPFDLVVTKGK